MRIAVLSDIHGNVAALERVVEDIERWAPDHVVVNGDIVNRGPRPLACWRLVRERMERAGWQVVKGNHEDYVAEHRQAKRPSEPQDKLHWGSYWTANRLGQDIVDDLAALPDVVHIDAGAGGEVRFVHASMRGNRDGIYPDTDEETLAEQVAPAPQLFASAHTHRPLLRRWQQTLVVNSGSVGLPFDRERAAAYARLAWHGGKWTAVIIRCDYNWERAWDDYETSGFLAEGGPLVPLHRIEFRDAISHLHLWSPLYLPAIEAGEMSVGEAVEDYIARHINVPVNGASWRP